MVLKINLAITFISVGRVVITMARTKARKIKKLIWNKMMMSLI